MDQKNANNSKKLPKALNREALRQVKGGYREMPGVVTAGSLSVRWDEIDIRFDDGIDSFLTGGPQGNTPTTTPQVGLVKGRP